MQEAIITELEQQYDFIVEDTPVRLGGLSNQNYVLTTNRGKIVVKRYNPYSSSEIRAVEHQALHHLRSKGIDYIPYLLVCQQSGQTTTTIEEETYAVFEFIEGEQYQRTLEQTTDAGRKLGFIHTGLEDLTLDSISPSRKRTIGIKEDWLQKIKEYDTSRGSSIGKEVLDILEETAKDYESEELRETHFHADYHPGNLLFDDENVRAVLDFEAVFKHGHRILDLAFGAYNFGMRYNKETWELEDIDEERFKSFLRGYNQTAKLTATEIVLLPEALITHRAEYLRRFLEEAVTLSTGSSASPESLVTVEYNIKEAAAIIKLAERKRKMITQFML